MGRAARLIVLAPGAGASSSSTFMRSVATRLSAFGEVSAFDYPYQIAGRRSPDRREVLVKAHIEALTRARAHHPGYRVALVGKSMGSRIGCHVAVEVKDRPKALVCLGYPLAGRGPEREGVLLELETPVLFIQGTRDPLCPLDRLENVRKRMKAPSELHVVQDGDHSLKPRKRSLAERGETEAGVESAIDRAIEKFLDARC